MNHVQRLNIAARRHGVEPRRLTRLLIGAVALVVTTAAFTTSTTLRHDTGFADPYAIAGGGIRATWVAVEQTVDSLREVGYDRIASGVATVNAHRIEWSVTGRDPKKVTMLAWNLDQRHAPPDSFVTYVHRP